MAWVQQQRQSLDSVLSALHTTAGAKRRGVQRLQSESKRLAREVDQLKMKVALGGGRAVGVRRAGQSGWARHARGRRASSS